MKVTLFSATLALIASFSLPIFASEHMHVNHDHEHTRYQPASTDQTTPAATPQDGSHAAPSGK